MFPCVYRAGNNGWYVVWRILFLLLLTSSASTCLQQSPKHVPTIISLSLHRLSSAAPFQSNGRKTATSSAVSSVQSTYESAARSNLGITIPPPPSILTVRPAKATRISSTHSGRPSPPPPPPEEEEETPKTDSAGKRCRPLIMAELGCLELNVGTSENVTQ